MKKSRSSPPVSAKAGSNQGAGISSSTRRRIKQIARALQHVGGAGGMADVGNRSGTGRIGNEQDRALQHVGAGLPLRFEKLRDPVRCGPFVIVDHGDELGIAFQGFGHQAVARRGDAAHRLDHRAQRPAIGGSAGACTDRNPDAPRRHCRQPERRYRRRCVSAAMASSSRARLLGRLQVGTAMTTRSAMMRPPVRHFPVQQDQDDDFAGENAAERRDRSQGEQECQASGRWRRYWHRCRYSPALSVPRQPA